LTPTHPSAYRTAVASSPENLKTLDASLARELARRGGVGASVAVVRDGRIALEGNYGRRSLDADARRVDETTMFGIGSVTKQFTSVAILLLAEDGKLSVDDKVAKYYPGLTKASDITVLDLMNHVSGYPDYYPLDFVDRRMMKAVAPDALLKKYAGGPLDFEPGTRWSYSNTGFVLLGRIVERASGRPLGAFLKDRIFSPLGMQHTDYDPHAADPRLARGYTSFALTPLQPATSEGPGWVGAAGAIFSTAADVARWDIGLMEGRVLKPVSWALMTKPRALANGRSTGYGCGLAIAQRHGVTVLTHGGALSGYVARNTMIPQSRSAVVALINDEDGPLANSLVDRALEILLPPDSRDAPVTRGPSAAGADRGEVPHVNGPAPAEAAKAFFRKLQSGTVDRSELSEDFSVFLTPEKARAAAERLASFGPPTGADVRSVGERGGMEVASVRLAFPSRRIDALMYRTPDGKLQEFLLFNP